MSKNVGEVSMPEILSLAKIIDKEKMYQSIQSFPQQISESAKIIKNYSLIRNQEILDIIICGMGGSAIGGDFCRNFLGSDIHYNIYVNREYNLPNWVSKNSLIILSSYSGDTEETISCYEECIKNSYNPIIITTGGYLLSAAKSNNHVCIQMPTGYQPRAALGFSFTLLLLIFNKLNLISKNNTFIDQIDSIVESLKKFNNTMFNDDSSALKIASDIYNKFVVIYSTRIHESISYRFRCQLAENSKIIASHNIFPEQNHNEIEAFQNDNIENIAFIWLIDESDSEKNKKRMKITQDLLNDTGTHSIITISNGSKYERILKMVNYLDWISYYCAILNNTNPTTIDKIKKLKKLL